jgi:hypothetical protein
VAWTTNSVTQTATPPELITATDSLHGVASGQLAVDACRDLGHHR